MRKRSSKAVSAPPPAANGSSEGHWKFTRTLAAVTLAAAVCKLVLAARTYGSNDVYAYERFFGWSQYLGVDLYQAAWDFNHPPSLLHFFRILGWVTNPAGPWFPFWLRVPAILADVGSVWIVLQILRARLNQASVRMALLMFAAAPALILISGFHGNTDSVMLVFLLLSVLLVEKRYTSLAGVAFGLSLCFKVVPVITLPVIYLYLADRRRRIAFLGVAGFTTLLAWSPYLLQSPATVLRHVFGYSSYYGHWGISYLALQLAGAVPQLAFLNNFLQRYGAYLLLASIPLLSVHLHRAGAPLYAQVGLVFFYFLSLSTGFGVQYLAWIVPWTVGLGAIPTAIFYAASGAFLFLVYNYWSQGMPWFLADSNRVGDYQGHFDYYQLLCWLTAILLAVTAARAAGLIRKPPSSQQSTAPNRNLAVALLVAVFVIIPFLLQVVQSPPGNLQAREGEVTATRAAQYLDLSTLLVQRQRYPDAIKAAETALQLDPRSAGAYNNMSVAYAAQGNWELSEHSAQKALEIQPGFELARNNLQWARQRKQAENQGASRSGAR